MTEGAGAPSPARHLQSHAGASHPQGDAVLTKYLLKLYVTGSSARSQTAIGNLQRVCQEDLHGEYELEIIDVAEQPDVAEADRILATPTLIKQLPPPLRRVIGDLSDKEKVLLGSRGSGTRQTSSDTESVRRGTMIDQEQCGGREALDRNSELRRHREGRAPRASHDTDLRDGRERQDRLRDAVSRGGDHGANENGVFVTFEESADDIRENMRSFGWDLTEWEREGKLAFVDASPDPAVETVESGSFDLGALLARVEHAVKRVGAKRVSVDSLGAMFSQFSDQSIVRRELFRIASALKAMKVTALLTAERIDEYGPIARFGVEEFIADNVMVLRNVLEDEVRRRTIEILKFRGTDHQKGEYPFTIIAGEGLVVIPLSAIELRQKSSNVRISSGNPELDQMCGGGFFRDSVILVSGATGTGKTLTVTQFLQGGAKNGERWLLLAFEESREQLFRNAQGWGIDFEEMESAGMLRVVCDYPEVAGLEDWLISIQRIVQEFKPSRVALDSLSALERVGSIKAFREFVIGVTSFIKQQEITGLFTSTTSTLMGGTLDHRDAYLDAH